jgi:hypothetical protein
VALVLRVSTDAVAAPVGSDGEMMDAVLRALVIGLTTNDRVRLEALARAARDLLAAHAGPHHPPLPGGTPSTTLVWGGAKASDWPEMSRAIAAGMQSIRERPDFDVNRDGPRFADWILRSLATHPRAHIPQTMPPERLEQVRAAVTKALITGLPIDAVIRRALAKARGVSLAIVRHDFDGM